MIAMVIKRNKAYENAIDYANAVTTAKITDGSLEISYRMSYIRMSGGYEWVP